MARPKTLGSYAPLSATYYQDDAMAEAGEAAELLFVRGLAFCANSMSDGFISDNQLLRFVGVGMRDAKKRAARLVQVGSWEQVEGGYVVRSWLKWNRSAEEIGAHLRRDRERKAAGKPAAFHAEGVTDSAGIPDGIQTESTGNPSDVPSGIQTDSSLACECAPDRACALHFTSRHVTSRSAASAAASKRGTRIPDDWEPDEELKAWVRKTCTNLTSEEMASHTRQFKRFWLSKTGRDATKLDWSMTYQNWMEKENGQRASRSINGRPPAVAATPGKVQITQ